MAIRTLVQRILCVLVTAVHAAVSVMVDRAIAYIVLIHQCHYVIYSLRIVGGIAINFHIKDVAATGELVVRSLNLGLVAR